jgi:carbamoyltransferase
LPCCLCLFFSPFDRALILTMDEQGDGTSGMIAIGEDTRIGVLRKIPFPHSLALIYTQITEFLGFAPHHDEHKAQWLTLEGEPVFKNIVDGEPERRLRRRPSLPLLSD